MSEQMVDIINEKDVVVGTTTREDSHKNPQLHRVVNIWFFNDNNEVLLQKNSLTKNHDAGKLSETVGGHVDAGESYDEAAVRETAEETGLHLGISDLVPVMTHVPTKKEQGQGMFHARKVYAYTFLGNATDLHATDGEGAGFEWVSIQDFLTKEGALKERIASYLFEFDDFFIHILKMAHETLTQKTHG
jgi:isopentenyldiphosphate isomerase